MKVYVLKNWEVRDLVSYWVNNRVVATVDEAERYVEGNRELRDYEEYDLDVSDLSYNQIFGEREIKSQPKYKFKQDVSLMEYYDSVGKCSLRVLHNFKKGTFIDKCEQSNYDYYGKLIVGTKIYFGKSIVFVEGSIEKYIEQLEE